MFEGILGLKKPIFGLDIGHETLKVVQVSGETNGHVLAMAEIPIAPQSLSKEGIRDKKKLAELIKEAVKQAKPHRVNAKIVSSAIPESLVFTKNLSLPEMNAKELAKNIPLQASEFFPVPAEETYMDWHVIEKVDRKNMEVLVVAAPKLLVDSFIEMVNLAGLELMGLETKPIAVCRALISPKDKNLYLVVDIGAQITGLVCCENGVVKVTSTVRLGGNGLKEDFASGVKILAGEILNQIKYYQNRLSEKKDFSKIILAGGGANTPQISEALAAATKLTVIIGQPIIKVINYNPKYAVAIGLAMKEI